MSLGRHRVVTYRLLKKNRDLILLVALYLIFRLVNLTLLPVFNDESIYLHWGWKELHEDGQLYYSLMDGKQPLLMWIFGYFENIFSSALFAGRFVGVVFGLLTLFGIYRIGIKVFNKRISLIAGGLYIVVPLFSFFDRQALMESAVGAIGVWLCYLFLELYEKQNLVLAFLIGVFFGLGLFMKSDVLIFLFPILFLSIYFSLTKMIHFTKKLFFSFVVFIITSQIVLYPLYRQWQFWINLSSHNRYVLTSELKSIPYRLWISHSVQGVNILFWHLGIIPFIIGIIGVISILFSRSWKQKYIALWTTVSLFFIFLLGKNISPRYVVSFVPLFTLYVGFAFNAVFKKHRMFGIFFLLFLPLELTLLQIFFPLEYFSVLDTFTKHSQKAEYVTNWTSGYGVSEACTFIEKIVKNKPSYVSVRGDFGNPEDGIFTCFQKKELIKPVYFDAGMLRRDMQDITCITDLSPATIPDYFISRDEQLGGLDDFLIEEKKFYKPERKSFIGVYRIKKDC